MNQWNTMEISMKCIVLSWMRPSLWIHQSFFSILWHIHWLVDWKLGAEILNSNKDNIAQILSHYRILTPKPSPFWLKCHCLCSDCLFCVFQWIFSINLTVSNENHCTQKKSKSKLKIVIENKIGDVMNVQTFSNSNDSNVNVRFSWNDFLLLLHFNDENEINTFNRTIQMITMIVEENQRLDSNSYHNTIMHIVNCGCPAKQSATKLLRKYAQLE